MTNLLDLFKNIDTQEDEDIKHTLQVMLSNSGVTIPEDADFYYQNQQNNEKEKKICLAGRKIKSLEPLRYLTNLQILVLNDNDISDISPLFELSNLQHLNLIGNDITSLEGIETLQKLEELYLGFNLLKDITPLSKLNNLKCLGLRRNTRITDITPLEKATNLVEVNLTGTSVTKEDADRLFGVLPGCKVIFD